MRDSEEDKRLIEMLMDHRYCVVIVQELYTSPFIVLGIIQVLDCTWYTPVHYPTFRKERTADPRRYIEPYRCSAV